MIPLEVGGCRILLTARDVAGSVLDDGGEREISGRRRPALEQVLDGVSAFAEEVVRRVQRTDADRITVTFGCEAVLESGSLVAAIGRASASSTFTVELEWSRRTSES